MSKSISIVALFFLALAMSFAGAARADALGDDIARLQHGWAEAYYQTPEKQQEARFEVLAQQAAQASARHPGRAEPLIWEAIILSSHAKAAGGLGALDMVKRSRDLLLAAEKIDPRSLDGSIYTSLGSLYAKVPGWPLSFGSRDRAREYLDRALAMNPQGIDPNYFYGDLLLDLGDRAGAETYLRRALAAPPRPGREDADAGRRAEIQAALARLRKA